MSNAGGLGFLASGYLSAAELADRRRRLDELTGRPFGVNLFVPGPAVEESAIARFQDGEAGPPEGRVEADGARTA